MLSDLNLLPSSRSRRLLSGLAVEAQAEPRASPRPADVIIATCAHVAGAGFLLHYDVLREHTSLRFESEWLAPAGSLS